MQVTVAASAPPSLPAQEVSISPPTMVTTPVSLVAFIIAAPSTIVTPLLSAGVTTTNALEMPPPSSSASSSPPLAILASASPSSSSHPNVSLDHVYSRDIDSMRSMGYRPEQRTPTSFMSSFDKNLIRSIGVQNETDSMTVFLQRSLVTLEENGQRHQEALSKMASLEAEVAKWRATARIVRRVKCPKVANAIVAFAEVVRSNHQLSSKVCDAFAKMLRIRPDGDKLVGRCWHLLRENNELVGKVESVAAEKDETSKVVADLQARLRENKSKLEEFELKASKERKTNKELEEELLVYKRKGMKQHEKGFYKAIRKAGFFAYNIDLGLFDPSRT